MTLRGQGVPLDHLEEIGMTGIEESLIGDEDLGPELR